MLITITSAIAPLTIAQLKITIEEPGVKEFDLDDKLVEKFKKSYENSNYYKRMAKADKLKISFKELTQSEVNEEFEKVEKLISENGKHSDLVGLNLEELKDVYEKEIGSASGNRKNTTMIKEIIEKREEIEAAGNN